MTAIIGVLNKHAVAIAADSAATLGGGRKVMNTANKLFALSKYYPVAIAVYGNAELLGTPWEVIIKEYRKKLGNTFYNTLKEYVDDFLTFLKDSNYFCTSDEASAFLKIAFNGFIQHLIQINKQDPTSALNEIAQIETLASSGFLDGFNDDDFRFVQTELDTEIKNGQTRLQKAGIMVELSRLQLVAGVLFTHKGVSLPQAAGLVFTGYGEQEYFPSLFDCKVNVVVNGKLAIEKGVRAIIDKNNVSSICPFAQTDVMQTILDGVSPLMRDVYMGCMGKTIEKIKKVIAKEIETVSPAKASIIRSLDTRPFLSDFISLSQKVQQQKYTMPFVMSVANLEKEDLADFAESLVTLTSLKRKVSLDQETVGGPVDVMLISKGDGVIWKKRKHYFNPEINHHFFSNYYNH